MRISPQERKVILSQVRSVYGVDAEVILFGSRVDDEKRGGDIDIMIDLHGSGFEIGQKFKLQSLLQLSLGEQKFDVVVTGDRYKDERLVVQEAVAKGVRL
ncbi:MAG: nucleotidyltransferase domain-containing protein [Calditrichaeota bacterium]|nr:MAG: nucleotidyltransferase domain-containing protein [Calditrichota bacterium]